MNNDDLLKFLIKEMVDESFNENEHLNEFLKQISNAASQVVDRVKGVGQNISATVQGAKAGFTGNIKGVAQANKQKQNVAINFMKNQGSRIEKDAANYFNQLNQRAQTTAQNKGGHVPGDEKADSKNHDYMLARALKGFSTAAKQANTESPAIKKTAQMIDTSINQAIKAVENPTQVARDQRRIDNSQRKNATAPASAAPASAAPASAAGATNNNTQTSKNKEWEKKLNNIVKSSGGKKNKNYNQRITDLAKEMGISPADNTRTINNVTQDIRNKLKSLKLTTVTESLLNNKNLSLNEIVDLVNYLY